MATVADAARPHARLTREQLTLAFNGQVQPARVSFFYLIGLLAVTGVMLLLPLVYIGLIGLVGYGLFYHATNNADILVTDYGVTGRGVWMAKTLIFFTPLLVGVLLLVFMIKPLVTSYSEEERVVSLSPSKDPLLFDFVRRLCMTLGAPTPTRIDVDLQANASAQLRPGVLSLMGKELILTIGLPLVGGLSLRQFTGVMAHEFGHFRQGLAMRLGYVISRIHGWFYRLAYDEDKWDDSLQDVAEVSGHFGIGVAIAGLFMLIVRGIMWVFLWLSQVVCCYMSRQSEFDADAQEIWVAGSDAFTRTAMELNHLNAAENQAFRSLRHLSREGRLPEDLVVYIVSLRRQIPKEVASKAQEQILAARGHLFSTHPPDSERIERARQANEPGVLQLDGPASDLFADFQTLSRELTQALYRRAFGAREMATKEMVSSTKVAEFRDDPPEDFAALDRFFCMLWGPDRPLKVRADALSDIADGEAAGEQLRRTRANIEKVLPQARELVAKYDQACGNQSLAQQARAMLEAGFKLDPRKLGLTEATVEQVDQMESQAAEAAAKYRSKLENLDAAQCKRLVLGLGLLKSNGSHAAVSEGEQLFRTTKGYLAVLAQLRPSMERLAEMVQKKRILESLTGNLQYDDRVRIPLVQIRKLTGAMREHIVAIKADLDRIPYPFKYIQDGISVGQYVLNAMPGEQDAKGIERASVATMQRLRETYLRILCRCVEAAERTEKAMGLAPLTTDNSRA